MDRPPQLPEPFPANQTPRKKSCLFGCLGIFIGAPVLLAIIGYYVVMHTAVPLRLLANTLNRDKSVKIEGIGGSISKGFTIESIRYTNRAGNVSVLEGLALQWSDLMRMNRNQELVIEKIALRRAHIFVDTSDKSSTTKSTTTTTTTSTSSSSSSSMGKINLFEIRNVDIREVVIESTTGDFKLELAQILMKGFRIKDSQLDLAALSVGSNFLDLNLEDALPDTIDGNPVPFTRRIVGVLKPEMHKSLTRKIDFTVELGAVGGQVIARARGFNGAVEAVNLGPLGHETITFKDFTPADFLAPDFSGPVSKLSMVIRTPEKTAEADPSPGNLESGNFTLGTTLFTMAPQVLDHDPSKPDESADPIIATSQRDGLEITATLKQSQQPPFYQVGLSSTPPREPRDLIALLWFGKPYNDLTADQTATVEATEKRNFPPQEPQSEK